MGSAGLLGLDQDRADMRHSSLPAQHPMIDVANMYIWADMSQWELCRQTFDKAPVLLKTSVSVFPMEHPRI